MRKPTCIAAAPALARKQPVISVITNHDVRRVLIVAMCFLVLNSLAVSAYAQASIVSATVDRTSLNSNEPLTLSITVNGANGQPDLQALDGFQILGSSSGRQISTINGNTTVQTLVQYHLVPLHAGDLLIPSIPVVVDGQTYQTDPIQVTVSQNAVPSAPPPAGSSAPPRFNSGSDPLDLFDMLDQWMQRPSGLGSLSGLGQLPISPSQSYEQIPAPADLQGQDYYVEAQVDKPTAYQGEQVLYTTRFYQAVNPYGQIQYQPPAFSGFWSKQLPDQKTYITEAGGRTYRVIEFQNALFPTVAGEIVIDPARFILDTAGADMGAWHAVPLHLDVQPLPAGAPASFQGAVGQYQMEAGVDKTEARVGDAVTQHVTITGVGNIEQVPDPAWPDDTAWRAFDSKSTSDSRFQDGRLVGIRRTERVLVPTQPGDLRLPVAEFSYFDPAAGQYRTINAEPVVVAVAPNGSAPASAAQPAPSQAPANTAASLQAARPLKVVAAQSLAAGASLPQQSIYWGLWALPVALVTGELVWQRRKRDADVNAAALRSQKAARQASRALAAAANEPQTTQEAAGRILAEYLSAKLQHPVTGLTQSALAERLLVRNVDPEVVARVQAILTQSDIGRYAPLGYSTSVSKLSETQQVIDDLERYL